MAKHILSTLLTLGLLFAFTRAGCFDERHPYQSESLFKFAVELTKRVAAKTENHFVVSPVSLSANLLSLSKRADGNTLEEFKTVYDRLEEDCYRSSVFETVYDLRNNSGAIVKRDGLLVFGDNVKTKDEFKAELEEDGGAEAISVVSNNSEEAAQTVNDHVSLKTEEKIKDVISADDAKNKTLLLLDALYFKGDFKRPFNKQSSRKRKFSNDQGVEVGETYQMVYLGGIRYVSARKCNAEVVELPYGTEDTYSLLIFLPFANENVTSVLDKLVNIKLTSLLYALENIALSPAFLTIPRFKITSTHNYLKDVLSAIGLNSIFNDASAFPNIAEDSIHVSDVVQKVEIEVTEAEEIPDPLPADGGFGHTEARNIILSRPFIFFVVNKNTDLILLSGAYSKPSVLDDAGSDFNSDYN